jgi:nascent polypeptide-associated complex subunit alpha
MLPGMNPRKMQQMMKQMGIQQKEIDAVSVVIKTADKEYVFDAPQVSRVNMMGQETFQVVGSPQVNELATFSVSEEDVSTVVEQTGASSEDAKKVLEEVEGDLAEAIMKLKSD